MSRILVIADDLTGAAEIAGIGARFGRPAHLLREPPTNESIADGLTALDTDSRSKSPARAAAIVEQFIAAVRFDQFDLIYKKTDSVLRGPVRAEIETMLRLLNRRAALLVPQNPSRGRTIDAGGTYRVGGVPLNQTEFANDPDRPAKTADVVQLVGNDVAYLAVKPHADWKGITIGTAETAQGIRRWADNVDSSILPAGGADFFAAILESRGLLLQSQSEATVNPGTKLFVNGSASAYSGKMADRAAASGIPIFRMPDALFFGGAAKSKTAFAAWPKEILNALSSTGHALMTIGRPIDATAGASDRALKNLTSAAFNVICDGKVDHLFIDGGATAAAMCRQLKWSRFAVARELASGVVELRTSGHSTTLTLKPGSYAWPDEVFPRG
jgi:uncharacterized protein YgbK (DUF1537 family)